MDQEFFQRMQKGRFGMNLNLTKVSVVLPYYQREAGLLAAALKSVYTQTAFDRVDNIIVVDDGSPLPAMTDVDSISDITALFEKVRVVKKANGGVSSARNAGLDVVPESSEYVAFLDPDDTWLPHHLEYALVALDSGSNFHFANFTQLGQTQGAFERTKQINITEHRQIASPNVFWFDKDMIRQITTANLIGTPTVVYRFGSVKNLRFSEKFRFAGEDYLMWLSLVSHLKKTSFSIKVSAKCGEGINLFSGAKWGTAHLCNRLFDEINYRSFILDKINLQPDNYNFVKSKIYENRKQYFSNSLSMLKHFRLIAIHLFFKHFFKGKYFRKLILNKV